MRSDCHGLLPFVILLMNFADFFPRPNLHSSRSSDLPRGGGYVDGKAPFPCIKQSLKINEALARDRDGLYACGGWLDFAGTKINVLDVFEWLL